MNIKLVNLRIANKKLKLKVKEYRRAISLEIRTNPGIVFLEKSLDDMKNENSHYKKSNEDYMCKHFNVTQKYLILERDLLACKRELAEAETIAADYKLLSKDYRENICRLSFDVVELTKKNESYKDNGIVSRIKNIFKKR